MEDFLTPNDFKKLIRKLSSPGCCTINDDLLKYVYNKFYDLTMPIKTQPIDTTKYDYFIDYYSRERTNLILYGPSGCGKSYLCDSLIKNYPNFFFKNRQVTTRPRRENEDDNQYLFVNKTEYELLKPVLVGKTNFNGNSYGSFYEPSQFITRDENNKPLLRINIIILNFEGLLDFVRNNKSGQDNAIIVNLDTIVYKNERAGRNYELFLSERFRNKIMKQDASVIYDIYANPVYTLNVNDNYATMDDIFSILHAENILSIRDKETNEII